MRKIFILSMWRSGTSWLEDILGKNVPGSTLFGHEQQILPLLTFYKKCYGKTPTSIRQRANRPVDDIDEKTFHDEFGLKQHKVLHNAFRYSKESFPDFAFRYIEFLLHNYSDYKQVVEKSPENLCPDVFDTAIEVLQHKPDYFMVYLIRRYIPYMASCYNKFVKRGKNDLEYYSDKWIQWNEHAINQKLPYNLYIINYEDLVKNPVENIKPFAVAWKQDIKVRDNVLNKWKDSKVLDKIESLYKKNESSIKFIEQLPSLNKD